MSSNPPPSSKKPPRQQLSPADAKLDQRRRNAEAAVKSRARKKKSEADTRAATVQVEQRIEVLTREVELLEAENERLERILEARILGDWVQDLEKRGVVERVVEGAGVGVSGSQGEAAVQRAAIEGGQESGEGFSPLGEEEEEEVGRVGLGGEDGEEGGEFFSSQSEESGQLFSQGGSEQTGLGDEFMDMSFEGCGSLSGESEWDEDALEQEPDDGDRGQYWVDLCAPLSQREIDAARKQAEEEGWK